MNKRQPERRYHKLSDSQLIKEYNSILERDGETLFAFVPNTKLSELEISVYDEEAARGEL